MSNLIKAQRKKLVLPLHLHWFHGTVDNETDPRTRNSVTSTNNLHYSNSQNSPESYLLINKPKYVFFIHNLATFVSVTRYLKLYGRNNIPTKKL